MTEQEKQLLLVDLCARLPYGVMCKIQTRFVFEDGTLRRGSYDKILDLDTVTEINEWKETGELEKFKPYLRPMSSMTEKERLELSRLTDDKFKFYLYTTKPEIICYEKYNYLEGLKVLDWLNANHFDFRNLIGKGLALEAPEVMYETKTE